jgi:hypothetical protein
MEASTWMGDHQGRPPAPLIRPLNDDIMERYQMNNNNNNTNSNNNNMLLLDLAGFLPVGRVFW